jgi:hypothetical protein
MRNLSLIAIVVVQDLVQVHTQVQVFQGSIVLRAQGEGTFIIVALVQNRQLFTAIPVIPGKAANISD